MVLSDLTSREAVLAAIRECDELGRDRFLEKYGFRPARRFRLIHDGKIYDSKAIAGVAYGYQFPDHGPLKFSEFSGGEETVRPVLERMGFEFSLSEEDESTSLQLLLEQFLASYPEQRATVAFGQHGELKNLMNSMGRCLRGLPALKAHPNVKVSWSLGAGNWARIPWVAMMDDRETTSTQRGIYCVFLFREDMSGVYLTLNQGVTDEVDKHGRTAGRDVLRSRARSIRDSATSLSEAGFAADDGIDLRTQGALGQDYEASTISYKLYSNGAVPPDGAINADLTALLDTYRSVLARKPTGEKRSVGFWIFQANPQIYDIDGALGHLSSLTWTVRDQAEHAAVGDKVFIWRSGREAGIVGIATITDAAAEIELPDAEAAYALDRDRLLGPKLRVRLQIDRTITPPLLRTTIAAEPRLKDLMILRFANYGTFPVEQIHAEALLEMLEEPAPQVGPSPRTWLYAPGRDAEYWDEFYESGLMGIGWNELGDLSQFGSVDDILAALQREYEPDGRPTNNARTCYDFVHTVRPGDLVFVKRGLSTIIGHGVVTGEYVHQADRSDLKNIRTVRWEGRGEWASPSTLPRKTLTDISDSADLLAELKRLTSVLPIEPARSLPASVREPYSVAQALQGLFMGREAFERALAIWRAKKNLIIQGAPGVGKSFVAKRLA